MAEPVWWPGRKLGPAEVWSKALWEWAARPASSSERALYVLLFALLVAVRIPRILLEGRFWAEEGRVFFENAWNLPWPNALLLSYGGYLNLPANLAGVLGRHLAPLSAAPYASTGIAFLIQCVPAIVIVTSSPDWLRSRAVLVTALLIIATPPASQEVWLSSIGSQFHLALAAAIILVLQPRAGPVGVLHVFVLLIAPLSGPASWVLAPLFALRALIDRSGARAAQALVLFMGLIAQLVYFFMETPGRHIGTPPTLLAAIVLVKHITMPLVSLHWMSIGNFFSKYNEAGGPIWPLFVVLPLFATAISAAVLHLRQPPLWLLLSGAAIAVSGYLGALGPKSDLLNVLGGDRYAFAPQALFGLALLSWGVIHPGRGSILARGTVVWLLAVGISDYCPPKNWMVQSGPPWRAEVQKWQQDPYYKLQIWPAGWSMTLPAR